VSVRFVTIADVAETLSISTRQALGLVSSGELPAIKIGKAWRIETTELEAFIQRAYADTRAQVESDAGVGVDSPDHSDHSV
jgi:excisionase family DNA binding protein